MDHPKPFKVTKNQTLKLETNKQIFSIPFQLLQETMETETLQVTKLPHPRYHNQIITHNLYLLL